MKEVGACVDRVYGSAATLEIRAVSGLCQRMKSICYMSSQVNNTALTTIVAGTMISVLDYLTDLIKANRVLRGDNKIQSEMQKRLDLLSSKFPANLKRTIA